MCRTEHFTRLHRLPVGVYADRWGQDGGDRRMIQTAAQGHRDPSENASAERVCVSALTRLTDVHLDA